MKKPKRILQLLASMTILSGPVLLLTACDNERDMSNLPTGGIPDHDKKKVILTFSGVNYTKTISDQFKNTYNSGLDLIINDVEGIMAKQKFYEFFNGKLGYSADKVDDNGNVTIGDANKAFEKIKDDLGLNILAQAYFDGLNKKQTLDDTDTVDLPFQNSAWHTSGSWKYDYAHTDFYKDNNYNPDTIFNKDTLYNLTDKDIDSKIATIAKHADDFYSKDIETLLQNHETWSNDTETNMLPPILAATGPGKTYTKDDITDYQQKLKRFEWWLRFRYQQYYQYKILPTLNQTLFTMSWILDKILNVTKGQVEDEPPKIEAQMNNQFIGQLQPFDFDRDDATSMYRLVWEYKTDSANGTKIDKDWDTSKVNWKSIISEDGLNLNPNFYNQLATPTNLGLNKTVDTSFGANGFTPNSTYSAEANKATSEGWLVGKGGYHYFVINKKYDNFVYVAPMYFLDIIQNLDFNYLRGSSPELVPTSTLNMFHDWNNSKHASSKLSRYLRNTITGKVWVGATQDQKWNTFWQMLYFLSANVATNSNQKSASADENFKNAAKELFPIYIPKSQIYEELFWQKVKDYY